MFKLIMSVGLAVAAANTYSGSGDYNNCDAWSKGDCPHSGATTTVGYALTFTKSTTSGHTEGNKLVIKDSKFIIH